MAVKKQRCGPGFATPLDAMKGPREKLIYVQCIYNGTGTHKPDYLATIDCDPLSEQYSKVIHRLPMPYVGDELHHSGWNVCSSRHGDCKRERNRLILPALVSSRIYVIDTCSNPRAIIGQVLWVMKTEMPKEDLLYLTVIHLKWKEGNNSTQFGYDFWYQVRHNVMISSEWGDPHAFLTGFNPKHVKEGRYGHTLHVWDWEKHVPIQDIDLGTGDGMLPLEVRFLHDPDEAQGYVGVSLSSNVFRFFKNENGTWDAEKVIDIPSNKVEGWMFPKMAAFVADLLISLDDSYMYFSNWVQGDIRQYDITDRKHPKLVGQAFIGRSMCKDENVILPDGEEQPEPVYIGDRRIYGGPQMIQLSLDGKRLYVTTSLQSAWDRMFYPDMVKHGAVMLQLDVDTEKGGLKINKNFLVDFGLEPEGPALAHEMRFPSGDCTSDIWV
ncbi:hypothetical protein EMCRGX_G030258 [Ephydatia muelleri]